MKNADKEREEILTLELSDKLTELGIKHKHDRKTFNYLVLVIQNPNNKKPMYAGCEIIGKLVGWVVDGPGVVDDGIDHSDINTAIEYITKIVKPTK